MRSIAPDAAGKFGAILEKSRSISFLRPDGRGYIAGGYSMRSIAPDAAGKFGAILEKSRGIYHSCVLTGAGI